ncbi:MAG: hypothetical protein HQM09_11120 [Candidatus Riflebacteria bacterium]|nr:hypothetical protein [Candidatus Riflebacteria bacterium]
MNIGNHKISAFSLLELIVVVCILGAIFLIAMPYYGNYASDTRHTVMQSNHKTLRNVLMEYHVDRGDYPHSADALNTLWSGSTRYVLDCPVDPEADAVASWGYVYYPAVGNNPAYYKLAQKYEDLLDISTGSAVIPTPTPTPAPVPPAVPTINAVTTPTSTTPQMIGGTKSADSVTIWVNGITTGVTYPDSTHWTYSLPLAVGVNPIGVYARSAAGLDSGIAHSSITRSTVAPTVPTINPVIALTASATQTITGSNGPEATQVLVNNIPATLTGTTWSFVMTLVEGVNPISVVAKDSLGNTSTAATSSITKDTIAPLVPTINAVTTPTAAPSQTISGTNAADAVTVLVNNASATVVGTNWSYVMTLVEGANAISVVAKDAIGNTSIAATSSITKDTTPPLVPTINAVTTPTAASSQTISGTNAADATTVLVNNATATVVGTNWSYVMTLVEGVNAISVVAKDTVGNTSAAATSSVTRDTTPPTVPIINAVTSPTNITSQTITGTNAADAMTVLVNNASATVIGTNWSYVITLVEGVNAISVVAKDALGNTSAAASSSITLDTIPPAAPTINAVTTPTNVTTQTLSGTKATDAATIWVNGTTTGVTYPTGTTWSYLITLLEGTNNISVVAKDIVGNSSTATSSSVLIALDTIPPAAPTIDAVTTPTNITPQVITGTKAADAATIWVNGTTTGVTYPTGTTWSYSLGLVAGSNAISVVAKDTLLNTSGGATSSIILDLTPPAVPTMTALSAYTTGTSCTVACGAVASATQYDFLRATDSGFTTGLASSGWIAGTSTSFTGLATGTMYYFRVQAKSAVGNISGNSAAVSTTMDAAPVVPTMTALSAYTTGTSCNVACGAVTGGALYYFQQATDAGFTTGLANSGWIAGTSNTFTGLATGTTYYFRVQAKSAGGNTSANSAAVSTIMDSATAVPTMTALSAYTTGTSCTVACGAVTGGALYYFQQATDAGFTTGLANSGWIAGTSTSFPGLATGTTYYFRVQAKSAGGSTSANSAAVSTIMDLTPSTPTMTALSAYTTGTSCNVACTYAAGATQYYFQQATDAGFTVGLANSGWIAGTSYNFTGLANGTLYYFRVQAKSAGGNTSANSAAVSTTINSGLATPVMAGLPTYSGGTSRSVSCGSVSGATLYYFQRATDAGFTVNLANSGWISPTSYNFTGLANGQTYYFRVQAKDAGTNYSANSAAVNTIMDTVAPTTTSNVVSSPVYNSQCYVILTPSDSVSGVAATYYKLSTDGAYTTYTAPFYYYSPGDGSDYTYTMLYYSVDAVGNAESPHSVTFTINTPVPSSTCPALYVWNGKNFASETDMAPLSYLGIKTPRGFKHPNPYEYRLLANTPQIQNDTCTFKFLEERDESDYLDNVKLYTIDYPKDRDIYSELRVFSHVDPGTVVHTVDKTLKKPLSIKLLNTGEDVSAKLAASDQDYLVLSKDRNLDFDWNTLEMDLGDLSNAPQIKLIVDANMEPTSTPAGMKRKIRLAPDNNYVKLEVLDASGTWIKAPVTQYRDPSAPKPKDACNAYLIDISKIFIANKYKLRLSFLFKTYIDSISFDTTLDQPVTVKEVPLVSATLGYYGFSVTTPGEIPQYTYGTNNMASYSHYFAGDYTKFGDVTSLLNKTDDKLVIFGGGDEVTATFGKTSPQPEGTSRRYMIYGFGYYRATANIDVAHKIEPLPFASMSNYPYTAPETYPMDAEHVQYRQEFNTRHFATETIGFPMVPTEAMIKNTAKGKAYGVAVKGLPTGITAAVDRAPVPTSLAADSSDRDSAHKTAVLTSISEISADSDITTPAMISASMVAGTKAINLACTPVTSNNPVKYQFIRYEQVITPYKIGRDWTTLCSGENSEDCWFESAYQASNDTSYGYSYKPVQYSPLFDSPSGTMDGIPDGTWYYAVKTVDANGVSSKVSAISGVTNKTSR